ncbi:MAG TPA: group III truncated hemoglobin [Gemmatimonadaceae bacterium]|nr:group III truncated hemoglobin [Gemmatimonadaceae bacterium]
MPSLPIVHRTDAPDAPDALDGVGAPDTDAPPELRDEDLYDLLVAFYDTVGRDELLAPYFAPVDMRAHMPRITDFWSTLLFHTGRYAGNAFRPHQAMPGLTARHFARWVGVLEATVDARFVGEAAERMKALGHRIAYSMQLRLGLEPFAAYVADVG